MYSLKDAALEESRDQISQSLVSVEAEGNESKKCSASNLIQIIDETSTTTNKFNDCLKQFTNSSSFISKYIYYFYNFCFYIKIPV